MKRRVAIGPLVLLLGIVLTGCDQPAPVAKAPGGPPAPPSPPVPIEAKVGGFAGGLEDLAAPVNAPPSPPPPADANTETVKAGVGVGAKGRSLDEHEGLVVTPAKAFFAFKEKAVFDIAIPQAMKLYKATEEKGPQSQAEFMEKIIAANLIKLPMLPPDAEYVYDVEKEELQVKRQKRQ